jgi:hypothetical protein
VTARIWIGGDLPRSTSYRLVLAIRSAGVSTGTPGLEDVICRPRSIAGLIEALTAEGWLHLCGEPDRLLGLVETCRSLGLPYRYWSDGTLEAGGDIDVPPRLPAPQPDVPVVDHGEVRRAVALLRAGDVDAALAVLEQAAPEIPELPPLRVTRG